MLSINTNIASLDAQNYLEKSSSFQTQTINEVTSGLRIVNSGDDAAGLAIANGLQSDQAVLTQGIRNASDGSASLQTIDGGINNITQLLDRASTLATQSASGTFTGDRTVLNSEFQSVLTEVNRQAQAIGLNTGGQFAQNLSVYIGGGRASGSTTANQNSSVSVDLSHSTVDTQSLGLSGYSASGNSSVDIGTGGGTTSVANLLANGTNTGSEAQTGFTTFYFSGPGFSDNSGANRIAVSVNTAGVTDVTSLATAINNAISTTGNGSTQQDTAFKNAGIQASVYVDPTSGKSSLKFTSSNSAFQVEAGDQLASAFLGNISSGSTGASVTPTTTATGTAVTAATVAETVKLGLTVGSTTSTATVNIGNGDSIATVLQDVNTGLAGTGVKASLDGNNNLIFSSTATNQATSISVAASGDTTNVLGLGTFATGAAGAASYTSITAGSAVTANDASGIEIAIGSQVANLGAVNVGATELTGLANLNTALQSNALTRAANITAIDNGGKIELVSGNGTQFRLNAYGQATNGLGFGTATSVASSATATLTATAETGSASPSIDAGGTSASGFLNFTGISVAGNSQTVTLTAPDSAGSDHSISFSLSSANSGNIDSAISYINTQLQQSNDSTLGQIVAVKDQSSGSDGIQFVSALNNFTLSLGTTSTGTSSAGVIQGISAGTGANSQGGAVISSSQLGTGSTVDISSETNAETALTALNNAVTILGRAQAAVGKGENLFSYATNLAQSQVTNEAAAESNIKDADLATEAANLSKAQILVQAGTAALAQANSAPQALLSLLRG